MQRSHLPNRLLTYIKIDVVVNYSFTRAKLQLVQYTTQYKIIKLYVVSK